MHDIAVFVEAVDRSIGHEGEDVVDYSLNFRSHLLHRFEYFLVAQESTGQNVKFGVQGNGQFSMPRIRIGIEGIEIAGPESMLIGCQATSQLSKDIAFQHNSDFVQVRDLSVRQINDSNALLRRNDDVTFRL